MAKRGRPRKNGARDGWVLFRVAIVLNAFDQTRRMGEKYEVAMKAAISAVHSCHPEMPISQTEVKRILAQWRPKGCEETMLVKEEIVEGPEVEIYFQVMSELAKVFPERANAPSSDKGAPKRVRRLVFGFGPAPHYPRHNAKHSAS